jgi:hypothetical protein
MGLKAQVRQNWIVCSEWGRPADSRCARNCSANASRPEIRDLVMPIASSGSVRGPDEGSAGRVAESWSVRPYRLDTGE